MHRKKSVTCLSYSRFHSFVVAVYHVKQKPFWPKCPDFMSNEHTAIALGFHYIFFLLPGLSGRSNRDTLRIHYSKKCAVLDESYLCILQLSPCIACNDWYFICDQYELRSHFS